MRLKASILLLLTFSPVLALARPRPAEVRIRPQVVRDRTPKARVHTPTVRGNNRVTSTQR
jgi:hypothetical protein